MRKKESLKPWTLVLVRLDGSRNSTDAELLAVTLWPVLYLFLSKAVHLPVICLQRKNIPPVSSTITVKAVASPAPIREEGLLLCLPSSPVLGKVREGLTVWMIVVVTLL